MCSALTYESQSLDGLITLRGHHKDIEQSLDLELPQSPNMCSLNLDTAILRLGPDEWLVLLLQDDEKRKRSRILSMRSQESLALYDVSDSRVLYKLSGKMLIETIQVGCTIDVVQTNLSPGWCSHTLFAGVKSSLFCLDNAPSVGLLFPSSYESHMRTWLDEVLKFTSETSNWV